jgi:hypothetical protein
MDQNQNMQPNTPVTEEEKEKKEGEQGATVEAPASDAASQQSEPTQG